MLKLVKTEVMPLTEQRIIRMALDTRLLQLMTVAEIRAVYSELEAVRDAISKMLDRADGKYV